MKEIKEGGAQKEVKAPQTQKQDEKEEGKSREMSERDIIIYKKYKELPPGMKRIMEDSTDEPQLKKQRLIQDFLGPPKSNTLKIGEEEEVNTGKCGHTVGVKGKGKGKMKGTLDTSERQEGGNKMTKDISEGSSKDQGGKETSTNQ